MSMLQFNYFNIDNALELYRIVNKNYDDFDLQTITHLAYENQICPFEFELDLSLFMDVIVCDYNYMFEIIIGKLCIMKNVCIHI